jgi:hypothetical protein
MQLEKYGKCNTKMQNNHDNVEMRGEKHMKV